MYRCLLLLVACGHAVAMSHPWMDTSLSPHDRAVKLCAAMTLDEKIGMLHGPPSGPCCSCPGNASCAYVGNVSPVARLGIPPINMNDGPQGFRDDVHPNTTTAWPSGLTMAASWDEDAMFEWGAGMGQEFYNKGANVQLGPGVCVARIPRNGRNFEYLSGEDPFLGSRLVKPVIKGIQSKKVVANAKHYAMNNQETNRMGVSEIVDERTRFEMYYPPFVGAIEAGVGSVMCSYNKINGFWSCENPETLQGDLKEKLGFKGWVMSDWLATHSMSINAGLDMEMPGAGAMSDDNLKTSVGNGTVPASKIDDSVIRILTPLFQVGVMDEPAGTYDWAKLAHNVTTEASVESARHLSAISHVMLKNDNGLLPLPTSGKTVAVIGAVDKAPVVHGGGSGSVAPSFIASPLHGIGNTLLDPATDLVATHDGFKPKAAAKAAAAADVAIVFVGTYSSEGSDRASLSLNDGGVSDRQNEMVAAVAAANNNTIVVVSTPGAILMPWSRDVAAILVNFMPGQQAGNAVADVIFGKVNPSGKLPLTMPNVENEQNFTTAQWPGLPDPTNPTYANYSEGLFFGYRYYDKHDIQFTTGFPFGHGLSFASFAYADLVVSPTGVSCTLENTGAVAGAEVAQLYLGFPEEAGEPPKLLRGFQKVTLAPGQKVNVSFPLDEKSFQIFDQDQHAWTRFPGNFSVFVGASSRDIRLTDTTLVVS